MVVPAGLAFTNFVILAIVVAALYFTRDILVPIALAVLLSVLLAPLVRILQRWRLPRWLAVMCTVAGALAVALSLATMVMIEVNLLVNDLPRYQATLASKVHNLREAVGHAGLLKNASSMLKNLDRELSTKDDKAVPAPREALSQERARAAPIPGHLAPWSVPAPRLRQSDAVRRLRRDRVSDRGLSPCRLNAWISPLGAPGVVVRSPMPKIVRRSASTPVQLWNILCRCRLENCRPDGSDRPMSR